MKLVIFERDWADEFSPFGFAVMTEAEFEEFKTHYSEPRDWFFGTNEGFEAENGDVLFEGCKVKDITKEQAVILTNLFNLKKYDWSYLDIGLFPGKPGDPE